VKSTSRAAAGPATTAGARAREFAPRPAILDSWHALHEGIPRRFEVELAHLTGQASLDLDAGFESLCEAVEVTAIQRSCERWSP